MGYSKDNNAYKQGQENDIIDNWPDDFSVQDSELLARILSDEFPIHNYGTYNPEAYQTVDYLYIISESLKPAYYILQDLLPILEIILTTRILHLFADLIVPGQQFVKNLITCCLGCRQIINYLSGFDETGTGTYLVILVILIYVPLPTLLPNPIVKITPKYGLNFNSHVISIIFITAPIFINEYYIYYLKLQCHTKLRSIIMTLSMKLTSQLYNDSVPKGLISTFAYLVHPATCIFGPWQQNKSSFYEVDTTRAHHLIRFRGQLTNVLRVAIKTLGILIVSGPLIDLISQTLVIKYESATLTKAFMVYLRALEFRFSHYLICHLTLVFLALWSDRNSENLISCVITQIEWPRSLVQVVDNWNIPVNNWLKLYIFDSIKVRTNHNTIPIMATFIVSSTLHGFKFHIWAVLLSLASLTDIECRIRNKLAKRFNACIQVRRCHFTKGGNCHKGHTRSEKNSYLTRSLNLLFKILALIHLAYLGYIFNGNTDEASYKDALDSWSELYFYSHVIIVISYAIFTLGLF